MLPPMRFLSALFAVSVLTASVAFPADPSRSKYRLNGGKWGRAAVSATETELKIGDETKSGMKFVGTGTATVKRSWPFVVAGVGLSVALLFIHDPGAKTKASSLAGAGTTLLSLFLYRNREVRIFRDTAKNQTIEIIVKGSNRSTLDQLAF